MRIKASEMERMFGMSQNGIRLYEKHGIIRPERSGSYRVYGREEMQVMGCAVQYRRYGFSVSETARLLSGADSARQIAAMKKRSDELEEEIHRLARVRKGLRLNARRIERALELQDRCDLEEKPAMYFLGMRRGEKLVDERTDELAGEWVERYAPHLSASLLLDGPYLTEEDYDEPPLGGIAVDAEVALELGLHQSEHVLYLPPKPCVVTAAPMEEGADLSDVFTRVRAFAKEKSLALHAGGLIRLVSCVREDGHASLTGLLWAPIAGDERRFGGMV